MTPDVELDAALDRLDLELQSTAPARGFGRGAARDPLLAALAHVVMLCVRRWLIAQQADPEAT